MTKSFFLLPLALCLVFQPHYTAAADGMVEKATKDSLIQMACAATASPPLCSSTLSAVANNPYLDPTAITITAVQAATKTAVATFDIINMSLTVDAQLISDPAVRQSLTICAAEYKNVIDNMDKASTSLTQKVDTPQVPQFLNTAMASVAKCDASGIKMTNKVVHIAAKNIDCTKLIKNALGIYQVFATYITNPSHDAKKGPAPLPPVPNVGGSIAGGAGAQIGGGVAGAAKGGTGPLGGGVGGAQGIGGNIVGALKGGSAGAPADADGGGSAGGSGGSIAGPLGGGIGGAHGIGDNVADPPGGIGGAQAIGGNIAGALKGRSAGASVNGGGSAGAPASAGGSAGASGGGIGGAQVIGGSSIGASGGHI